MSVIDQIATAIGADRILTGKDAAPYGKDWTGAYTSTPLAVLRPMSTAEVAAIMRIAHATRTPVVPLFPAATGSGPGPRWRMAR